MRERDLPPLLQNLTLGFAKMLILLSPPPRGRLGAAGGQDEVEMPRQK